MAGQRSMIKPTNKIVLDSQNMHIQTMKVETATNMYPGRLVKVGTNDDDAIVNTTDGAIGWLGYEQTTKKYRPATVDTIYAQNDQVAVLSGPGMVLVASLAVGAVVTKGALLEPVAAGELSGGTVGTHQFVAIAEEAKDADVTAQDIIVRSLI